MKRSVQLLSCCFYFYSVSGQSTGNSAREINSPVNQSQQFSRLSPAGTTRAGSNIDVTYHRCYWRINPDSSAKGIKGSVMTKFTTTVNNVTSVAFDMHAVLLIDSVHFRNAKLAAGNISRSGNVATILLGASLPKNIADSITIFYHGAPPNPSGASIGYVKSSTASAGNFVYTVSQPYEDKDWWPCKADLTDKIDSIDIYINTPTGFKAASNGTLVSSVTAGGSVTHFWKHRYAIPSYLVCVGVAKYTQLNSGTVNIGGIDMPVYHYVFQRASYTSLQSTLDLCKPMLTAFSSLLGDYPYKNEKYGHYEHQSNAGGMEHATFSGMSAGAMADWSVIAHELGHQWFGDKVTCGSWNHIWLNEGFAQFMETLGAEMVPSLNGNLSSIRSTIKTGARNISTLSPYLATVNTTDDIFGANTGRYYQRGAVIVSMLRALLGDAKFFEGLRNYLNDPMLAYNTAVSDDLKTHLEAVSGISLTAFFNDWVYGTGNPNYNVQWGLNNKRIYISVVQTRSAGSSVSYFNMPVVLRFSSASKDTTVVIYDQAGTLSYAGGDFAPSATPDKISYDLSFVPTAVTLDPLNVTMATGVTGLLTTLDVAIKDFSVTKSASSRKLELLLNDNSTVDRVMLQKSFDGQHFIDLGEMKNSLAVTQYSLIDASPSIIVYYRAKCTLHSGVEKYSKVIYWSDEERVNVKLSPNPVADQLVISNWPESWPKEVNIQVVNYEGARVWYKQRQVMSARTRLQFKKFPPGMYFIRASSINNERLLNEKFVIGY